MSEKSNLPEFPDRETLLEYVRGGLTPFKRHQIEKLMLEHEFLRHAVEGLESEDPESLEEDLAELSDTIRVRSGMITRPGFNIYQLAATVSLIIMASVIIYVLVDWITQSDWEKRLSLNQTVQTESADSLMDQKSPETEQGGNVEGEVGQLQDRKDEQKPGKISVEEIGQAVLNKPPVSLEKPVEKSEDQLTNQPVRSQAESLPGRDEEPSRPFITQPIPEKQELIEEYTATEREEGKHARDKDVPSAVAASTLTTVAVFLPVVFLEGIAAQLFRDMALTVSFSLLASLAVSLTLIPMMAALIARPGETADAAATVPAGRIRRLFRAVFVGLPSLLLRLVRIGLHWAGWVVALLARPLTWAFDRTLGALIHGYPVMLRGALRARFAVLAVALLLFGSSLVLLPRLGLDLIPQFSQGEFSFSIVLPEGTPLEITDRFVAEIQSVLEDEPRVEAFTSISGGVGLSLTRTGTEGENVARIQLRMAPDTTREDEADVIGRLRERLDASELVRFKFERPSYFSFRTPIEIEVYSDNLEQLFASASEIRESVQDVRGLVDVKSSAELGNPEMQVVFNNDQLMNLGLDVFTVASTIRNKVQGEVATRFTEGDREIDIIVRSVEMGRASIDDVQDMIVGQRDGVPIYLKSVADVRLSKGPSEIRRIGQKRAAVVTGNIEGRDMAAVAADIRHALSSLALPGNVSAFLSGQEEEMSRSLRSLLMAMVLAIFLVYLVMASQFESFLHPFVIIFTLPLGAIGVILALLLSGRTINVVAMIGMVMLAGIVVNNAIVLIDAINRRRRDDGMSKHTAIIEAARNRLRPILMTSATTILALLPMALGLGEGAELRSPLAITVIGGLAVATGLTLLVIPVVYSLLDRKALAADLAESHEQPRRGATIPLMPGSSGVSR